MRVKDLERTANVAWSPANQDSIYLASGTAAQQLDASFNTNAVLEIYSLNLADLSLDLELKASTPSDSRFHNVVWGSYGQQNGTIVGGCDGGVIQIYNAAKLFNGENGMVSKQDKHTGPVHALDFNPFQGNLLATGASESEIYIWDMNNTATPMTPGAKSQPFEDVLSIAWNRQVQHILASTFSSKCVVWDLRKNEPIIKLTDTVSRIRWKSVQWHPEVATQLCLASEEDHSPIIQLWDLRFATSPLKTLENHQRGILSIAWCTQDSDLLVSCSKDNRIICWNPNSNQPGGEVLSEVARTNQWNFDVAWCPKNPALIASPSFDGHVAIYSVMGGKTQQIHTTNKIADSFPGMDGYTQPPVPQQNVAPVVSADLAKPPKWLKRPVGASFAFGGKLITFENDKSGVIQAQQNVQPGQQVPIMSRVVHVSQVLTEEELVTKSKELEQALEYGNFIEYCYKKAEITSDQHKKYIWHFIKANFEQNPRSEFLNLLGYNIEDVHAKLNELANINDGLEGLNDDFSKLHQTNLLDADINNSSGDSPNLSASDFNADPFAAVTQHPEPKKIAESYRITTGDDTDGLIAQAIILGNVEAAVELCIKAKRFADAIIIAMRGGSELLAKAQYKYFQQSEGYVSSLINAFASEDWESVINHCDINSWKEALCAAIIHSSEDDFPRLCETLGSRLERESNGNEKLLRDAQLCYICSGNFEKLVRFWSGKAQSSTHELQELVELVTLLQKAFERQGRKVEITGNLAELLTNYSFILASQGNLQTALQYLGNSQDEQVAALRERLFVSSGQKPAYSQAPVRTTSTRSSFSNYPNTFAPANQFSQPNYNQFTTGMPTSNAPAAPSWQTQAAFAPKAFSPGAAAQPSAALPPTAPPTLPPRPTSVGSGHAGSGLPTRTKYVVDPSVQSNQYGSRNMYSSNQQIPPAFQANATNPYTPPHMSQLNPPLTPASSLPLMQPANTFNPPIHNQPMPQCDLQSQGPEMAQSAMNILPSNAAPGWNDPPSFHKANRPQTKPELSKQDPITHPLYGVAPAQNNGFGDQYAHMPSNSNPMYGQQNQSYQPPPVSGFNQAPPTSGFNQPPPTSGFNQPPPATGFNQPPPSGFTQPPSSGGFGQHGGFNTNPVSAFNTNNASFKQPEAQPETPQHIQKPPIPEEHMHMQTILDELRHKCGCAASNPQIKRKIDDVSRKLESLYDLLREHKLSPNTLAILHQMVQLIQTGDYMGGLNLHTQLVSGSDFAQIATFMPGLKVLLQSATQLQVYL